MYVKHELQTEVSSLCNHGLSSPYTCMYIAIYIQSTTASNIKLARKFSVPINDSWPEIADMNDLNSVIRVIKKLYRMSMENFQQSLTLLCGSLLATFVDV